MVDFNPDLMMTFLIGARQDEFFYEDVTEVGSLIRGAYFSVDKDGQPAGSGLDFQITDPNRDVVFRRTDTHEALFYFIANMVSSFLCENLRCPFHLSKHPLLPYSFSIYHPRKLGAMK